MVLTRLPLTITGRRCAFGWAWAASSSPQLQKAMPLAAAPLRKVLRVVMVASRYSEAGRFLVDRSVAYRSVLDLLPTHCQALGARAIAPGRDLDTSRHFVARTSGRCVETNFSGAASGFRRTWERSSRERWNP